MPGSLRAVTWIKGDFVRNNFLEIFHHVQSAIAGHMRRSDISQVFFNISCYTLFGIGKTKRVRPLTSIKKTGTGGISQRELELINT